MSVESSGVVCCNVDEETIVVDDGDNEFGAFEDDSIILVVVLPIGVLISTDDVDNVDNVDIDEEASLVNIGVAVDSPLSNVVFIVVCKVVDGISGVVVDVVVVDTNVVVGAGVSAKVVGGHGCSLQF